MKYRMLIAIGVSMLMGGCGGDDSSGPACTTTNPAPPDVSGTWLLSSLQLTDSTCPAAVNDIVDQVIGTLPNSCDVQVTQSGNAVTLVDCDNETINGCVDAAGVIRAQSSASEKQNGCNVSLNETLIADSSTPESTAEFQLALTISGNCTVTTNCNLTLEADWARVGPSARRNGDRGGISLQRLTDALAAEL